MYCQLRGVKREVIGSVVFLPPTKPQMDPGPTHLDTRRHSDTYICLHLQHPDTRRHTARFTRHTGAPRVSGCVADWPGVMYDPRLAILHGCLTEYRAERIGQSPTDVRLRPATVNGKVNSHRSTTTGHWRGAAAGAYRLCSTAEAADTV